MAVTRVVMPKLSEAMETGKLIKWIKKEGDRVSGGDILAEVETDKADVEMEAFGGGVLRKILVKEGDTVPVGALIAVIAEPSDDIAAVVGSAEGAAASPAPAAPPAAASAAPAAASATVGRSTDAQAPAPSAQAEAPTTDAEAPAPSAGASSPAAAVGTSSRPATVPPQPRSEDHATVAKPEPAARTPAAAAATGAPAAAQSRESAGAPAAGARQPAGAPVAGARQSVPHTPAVGAPLPEGARVKASPLARKIAAQSGVDLKLVQGTGPGGRVVRRDVEAASVEGAGSRADVAAAQLGAAARAASRTAATDLGPEYEDQPLSQMRAVIAKRMPLSKAPVPHFYVSSEVAMDRAWELREELNALDGQPKISVNDFVVRACAIALLDHPGVNASFQGEAIRVFHRAHVGIAVALEEGLITPVLRDAHAKGLSQIAVESRDLAERARNRKLRAQEMSGATFSISNLGMYDVTEFSAIINPPEGAILAVGTVRRVPVVDEAGLGVGRRMMLTLSCDHRVMDGAMGARFLQDVKRLLEEPLRLLV